MSRLVGSNVNPSVTWDAVAVGAQPAARRPVEPSTQARARASVERFTALFMLLFMLREV